MTVSPDCEDTACLWWVPITGYTIVHRTLIIRYLLGKSNNLLEGTIRGAKVVVWYAIISPWLLTWKGHVLHWPEALYRDERVGDQVWPRFSKLGMFPGVMILWTAWETAAGSDFISEVYERPKRSSILSKILPLSIHHWARWQDRLLLRGDFAAACLVRKGSPATSSQPTCHGHDVFTACWWGIAGQVRSNFGVLWLLRRGWSYLMWSVSVVMIRPQFWGLSPHRPETVGCWTSLSSVHAFPVISLRMCWLLFSSSLSQRLCFRWFFQFKKARSFPKVDMVCFSHGTWDVKR